MAWLSVTSLIAEGLSIWVPLALTVVISGRMMASYASLLRPGAVELDGRIGTRRISLRLDV